MTGEPAWTLDTLKAYFEAILLEQRLATEKATEEREKAAQILREGLVQQIRTGDEALERHIGEQVRQIRQHIQLNGKAVEAAFAASEKAIQKAEVATEKRFESVNEFRAQLTDQTSTFMPREVCEPRLSAIEKWQAKIIGALVLVTVVLPGGVAFAVYLLTRTSIPVEP